jgi:hypothetical protein
MLWKVVFGICCITAANAHANGNTHSRESTLHLLSNPATEGAVVELAHHTGPDIAEGNLLLFGAEAPFDFVKPVLEDVDSLPPKLFACSDIIQACNKVFNKTVPSAGWVNGLLQGKTLRIGGFLHEYKNGSEKMTAMGGFFFTVWEEMAKRGGFEIEWVYHTRKPSQSTDLYTIDFTDRVDVVGQMAFFDTPVRRNLNLNFLRSPGPRLDVLLIGRGAAVAGKNDWHWLFGFLHPFSWDLWVLIVCMLVFSAWTMTYFETSKREGGGGSLLAFNGHFYNVWTEFTGVGANAPETAAGKAYHMSWSFVLLILINGEHQWRQLVWLWCGRSIPLFLSASLPLLLFGCCNMQTNKTGYVANMASFLTIQALPQLAIENIVDAQTHGASVCYTEDVAPEIEIIKAKYPRLVLYRYPSLRATTFTIIR